MPWTRSPRTKRHSVARCCNWHRACYAHCDGVLVRFVRCVCFHSFVYPRRTSCLRTRVRFGLWECHLPPWQALTAHANLTGKGGKNRRRGKNENEEKRDLVFKEDGQGMYCCM